MIKILRWLARVAGVVYTALVIIGIQKVLDAGDPDACWWIAGVLFGLLLFVGIPFWLVWSRYGEYW